MDYSRRVAKRKIWSQCTKCESLSECTGAVNDGYELVLDTEIVSVSSSYECRSENECSKIRTEAKTYFKT